MTIKVDFEDEELSDALQLHLNEGTRMQTYIKAAIRYFNVMRKKELEGSKCGYGDKDRFKTYNTEESPSAYLSGER